MSPLLTAFAAPCLASGKSSQLTFRASGGVGRRVKILNRESFSDFILAYVGVSDRRALTVAPLGDKRPYGWGL